MALGPRAGAPRSDCPGSPGRKGPAGSGAAVAAWRSLTLLAFSWLSRWVSNYVAPAVATLPWPQVAWQFRLTVALAPTPHFQGGSVFWAPCLFAVLPGHALGPVGQKVR